MTNEAPSHPTAFSAAESAKLRDYFISQVSPQLQNEKNVSQQVYKEHLIQQMQEVYTRLKLQLPEAARKQLLNDVLNELTGYGPIQPLLDNPEVSEVMVNNAKKIYVEIKGQLVKAKETFDNNEQVMHVIERIIQPLGRHIGPDNLMVDARLPDGSRVNAVIPPIAIDGPSITIRKFSREKLTSEELVRIGSLTGKMVDLLRACVCARLNIVISGGTGSGKTTLLNVLSGFIPENERIITIEDAAELQLQQDHVLRLETRTRSAEGTGEVSIRDLVRNSLRMRPDRIVVGECRGGEALDMLQAMNTGHDGSLTTVHANSPRDAISRLETLVLMAGVELPLKVIRQQIASAVDLIVQQTRLKDGTRKVTAITEVSGMEGDIVVMTDIFKFDQTGIGEEGAVIGELRPTGIRPLFMKRLEAAGIHLALDVFGIPKPDKSERDRKK
jgi:pilus assembly protein CpaF